MAGAIDTLVKPDTDGAFLARFFAMFHPGYGFGAIGDQENSRSFLARRYVVAPKSLSVLPAVYGDNRLSRGPVPYALEASKGYGSCQ